MRIASLFRWLPPDNIVPFARRYRSTEIVPIIIRTARSIQAPLQGASGSTRARRRPSFADGGSGDDSLCNAHIAHWTKEAAKWACH
jgi:transposase